MSVTTRLTGLVAAAAICVGGALVAPAMADDDAPTADPCASQQAKVDKAVDALARVTAVFERQQAKVKKAKKEVAKADAGREKAEARKALHKAKDKRDDTKVTKRAQQMRLAKAQERLDTCLAAQTPTETPTETPAA